ncbi:MAG: adenosylcobinamide-GDP ribazoletransferase [Coriobacteriia bacterium]|nr:adenosylcobinamide-GDP ribazoletransferase [Coriobacteriia bacterium]
MATEHPLRDAGLALSLLTAIPTRAGWPEDGRVQSAAWFPAVGLLLGIAGYGAAKLAALAGGALRAPLVVAGCIVVAWALVTRLLHWDGLADVADGFWGSHDTARRLEIMSDSHTGAFGATVLSLTAILQVAAIAAILSASHESVLIVVPAFARFSATMAAWLGKPARPGGLGRSVMGAPTPLSLAIVGLTVAIAFAVLWFGFGVTGAVLGGLGMLLALAIPHVLSERFGGVTGDVMGASVLLTETVLLVAFVLAVV